MRFRKSDNLIPGGRTHNFKDFINFPDIGKSSFRYKSEEPIEHPDLTGRSSLFPVIRDKDIVLFFPYMSYNHILDLLREAAFDPKVEDIKITL
jgi:polyphosphate kinase